MSHPLCIATDSPPVPAGWYTVCASDALPAGGMQPFRLAGLTLLAWRDKNGTPCVTDRRCPHLGGDLAAGHVSDAGLVCPIHRFVFAADGSCRATGFDGVSGKAHIQPWPLLEQDGLLLVYYHPDGHAPQWQPPAHDWQRWTAQRIDSCELPATVQLITEGIADKGHLATVHGYSDVSLTAAFCCDGPTLATAYRFVNSGALPGAGPLGQWLASLLPLRMPVSFDYHAYGLGHTLTEVQLPSLGVRMRHFVNPTPVDDNTVRLFHSMALAIDKTNMPAMLRWLPKALLARLMFTALYKGFRHDLADDIAMWSTMQSVTQPQLCKADGPVNKFRQWARQFYG